MPKSRMLILSVIIVAILMLATFNVNPADSQFEIDLDDIDMSFLGEGGSDRFGNSISNAGDVNGDGFDDFIWYFYAELFFKFVKYCNCSQRIYSQIGQTGTQCDVVGVTFLFPGDHCSYRFSQISVHSPLFVLPEQKSLKHCSALAAKELSGCNVNGLRYG